MAPSPGPRWVWGWALLLSLCCASPEPRRTTPFPLTRQLEPAGHAVVIYTPRRGVHLDECGLVTVTFEVVGVNRSPYALVALVHIGDAHPVPVPLDSPGPKSLRVRLGEAGKSPPFPAPTSRTEPAVMTPVRVCLVSLTSSLASTGDHSIRVTVLAASARTPDERFPSAELSFSCGTRSSHTQNPQQPKAGSALESLRVWEAAIRGDIGNKLPAQAFAAEHARSGGDSSREPRDTEWNREFVEGSGVLFGEGKIDSDESGGRLEREAEGMRRMQHAAAFGDFNAAAVSALLWARSPGGTRAEGAGKLGVEDVGLMESPGVVQVLRECLELTGAPPTPEPQRGEEGKHGSTRAGVGGLGGARKLRGRGGHPLCHMALAFRLWKGLGTAVDYGAALHHYRYAAHLAMRTVDPIGGGGGYVAGGGGRRGAGSTRLMEPGEEARMLEDLEDDYRVVAAVQGARGRLSQVQQHKRAPNPPKEPCKRAGLTKGTGCSGAVAGVAGR